MTFPRNRNLTRTLLILDFNGRAGRFGWPHPGTGYRHYWPKPRTIQTSLFGGNVVQFTPKKSFSCYLTKREANHVLPFQGGKRHA